MLHAYEQAYQEQTYKQTTNNKQMRGGITMDEKSRRESSISVQSRVSVIDLARLDWFWSKQGVQMRSMSQLVNWSLMEMADQLVKQGHMGDEVMSSVLSAHKYLQTRGLYQRSHAKRSGSRLAMAIKFESMRKAGLDPEREHPRAHGQIHNEYSIESHAGPDYKEMISQSEWDEIKKERQRAKHEEYVRAKEQTLKDACESGVIVDHYTGAKCRIPGEGFTPGTRSEELDKYDEAREKEIRAKENQPPDTSKMIFADE